MSSGTSGARVYAQPRVSAIGSGVLACRSFRGIVVAGNVHADPADDAMAKAQRAVRQAEQTTEAMHTAQLDLDKKLAAQKTAEKKHTDDLAAADAAKSQLATYQGRSTSSPARCTWVAAPTA